MTCYYHCRHHHRHYSTTIAIDVRDRRFFRLPHDLAAGVRVRRASTDAWRLYVPTVVLRLF